MSQHNCKIGRTYFKFSGYCCNVKGRINELSAEEVKKLAHYIRHLKASGKIHEFL